MPSSAPSLKATASISVATMAGDTQSGDARARSLPNYERPEYRDQQPLRDLCHDLMEGTQAIRRRGKVYLPKWSAESEEDYAVRAAAAHVTGYYQRTVQASVGMILHEPPKIPEDSDKLILSDWEDIDGEGTHGEVFSKLVTVDAINGGFGAILVDAPPMPDGLRQDQADVLNLRPTWVRIPADRILSWVVEAPDWPALIQAYVAGDLTADQVRASAKSTVLRQVVIHEPTDVAAGTFGIEVRDRYRVLRLTDSGVTFQVWEHRTAQGETQGERFDLIADGAMTAAKGQAFRQIPLAVVYAGTKKAPFVAKPPLLALAELNLDHYQVSVDRRYLMRLCHAPTLFLAGFQSEDDGTGRSGKRKIGPNTVLESSVSDAKAAWVSADASALDSSQTEKEELVRQMATLGMSFLGKDLKTASETATGRVLDDAAENSTHATVARALQDGLEQALHFHALYRGVEPPEVTVNTTYAAPTVDAQMAAILWQAVITDRLDVASWIEYVQTGSLPEDVELRLDSLKLAALAQPVQPVQPVQSGAPNTGAMPGAPKQIAGANATANATGNAA